MRIFIDIGHPAQVHFFKNIIWELEKRGHVVKIALRDKDVARYLLDLYGFDYEVITDRHYEGFSRKALGLAWIDYKMYKLARQFNPDIILGETGYASHVGMLIGRPSILFCNNEQAVIENALFLPFADVICTPSCFGKEFWFKKQTRYNGYYFLPYLHPKYFTPDSAVFDDLGLNPHEKFVLLRFRTYNATHDIGQKNILTDQLQLVKELENWGRVFIKSDRALGDDLKEYELPPIEKMHDLLYFADLYVGDGISMAAEAAILGTPSILISTLQWGYIKELRDKYGLLHTCKDVKAALNLLNSPENVGDMKEIWAKKRGIMLSEKIDVVSYVANLVESFPAVGEGG